MRVLKLVFKNTFRHKLRSFLTILGIAIAVMAFGVLRTFVNIWDASLESTAANRLITRQAVSFIFPLPLSYREQIAKIPGVNIVSYANWFGGTYIDKTQFFARMAVDPETMFEAYPEYIVPPEQFEVFKKERNACVIGSDIATRYNLKLNDRMQIEGDIYPGTWDFVVRGIYQPRDKNTDATQMFFHWAYVDERMNQEMPTRAGEVGWYIVKIDDPAKAGTISAQIDALFQNSPNATKTESERAFVQGFVSAASSIITAMDVVSFVIIGIIMLVLGNTMIMAARERIREYAVFKTLGFSAGHLVGLILGESLTISVMGGLLGVAATYPIVEFLSMVLPKGFFPLFYVEPLLVIVAGLAALGVGLLASIFPIQRALATKIVDGLRHMG